MTITIRASVRQGSGGAWFAHARAFDRSDGYRIIAGRSSDMCYSHPEAMQAAYKLMADLDRELMDEVHASRASRRAQRCTECGDVVPEGKAHWKLSEDPCIVLDADQIDADLTEDTYPMEATA